MAATLTIRLIILQINPSCYYNVTVKGLSGFCLSIIIFEDGKFIHTNEESFFDEEGAEKYMTLTLGRE